MWVLTKTGLLRNIVPTVAIGKATLAPRIIYLFVTSPSDGRMDLLSGFVRRCSSVLDLYQEEDGLHVRSLWVS
jgi:hypothetical protein